MKSIVNDVYMILFACKCYCPSSQRIERVYVVEFHSSWNEIHAI